MTISVDMHKKSGMSGLLIINGKHHSLILRNVAKAPYSVFSMRP